MEDELLELNGFEKSVMRLYRRFGALGLITLVTLFAILASVAAAIPMISMIASSVSAAELNDPFTYLHIAIVVPLVVAPPSCIVFTRLLRRLDNAVKKVTQLSTTDPLTGSANRRGFMDSASQNIRTLTDADTCVIGMVDLDKFKLVNDTFGHQVGDEALTCVARSLSDEIGNLGLVGRLGGDEFAFVAFGPNSVLKKLKERIRFQCARLKLTEEVYITCSIGMVNLRESENIEGALARADDLLYQIKSGVRDHTNESARNSENVVKFAAK